MTLTLVVPQLLWPRQVMRDTLFDLQLPALETLLGKGQRLASPPADTADQWWCRRFDLSDNVLPAAALRMRAWNIETDDSDWLCLDPVHLSLVTGGATVGDPSQLDINATEAEQLCATLKTIFASVGTLEMANPNAWHLRLKDKAPAFPQRLQDVVGQSAAMLLPTDAAGRPWRALINDAQIALHNHPVNIARAERGIPTINSIAPWGGGRLPAMPLQKNTASLLSNDPVIVGLGKLTACKVNALPRRHAPTTNDTIVSWDRLVLPSATHDALQWREALLQLENDWLVPAMSAVGKGKLPRLTLHAFGDDESASISLTRSDLWKFWRQSKRLETL
jgi:hypothetical protein